MIFLTNHDVQQILKMEDCIRVLEEGEVEQSRGELVARPRIDIITSTRTPHRFYRWGTMEGTSKALQSHAIRMKSDVVYRESQGDRVIEEKYASRPGFYCGLVFLFDTSTGEPLALMQEGYLQHLRVGARNALGVKYLARHDAAVVGMIGSGGMARTHAMAFCAVRKIRRIQVYSPTAKNREAYAREMSEKLKIEVDPVKSPAEAVKGAEIVATCTDSTDPVLKGEWLEEGVFVTTVKGTTELDESTLKRVDIFFTFAPEAPSEREQDKSWKTHAHRISGTHGAYVAGRPEDLARIPEVTKERKVDGGKIVSFKDLFGDKTGGRANDRQIISMTGNHIQGIQFASVGGQTVELIRERGLGREFPTDWLLQDIRN